jgi:hypothetical protein
MTARALAARLDGEGDVLLAGPAVRAAAGRQAHLPPGVSRVLTRSRPWMAPDAGPVRGTEIRELLRRLARLRPDLAIILTSAHQAAAVGTPMTPADVVEAVESLVGVAA